MNKWALLKNEWVNLDFDSYITTHKLVGVQWQPMELGL
jgi:hypothetical protein